MLHGLASLEARMVGLGVDEARLQSVTDRHQFIDFDDNTILLRKGWE